MKLSDLINKLHSSSITIEDFANAIPLGKQIYFDQILMKIAEARKHQESELLEYTLIAAEKDGLDRKYTKLFCALLKERWHYCHEDIVMFLEKIRDRESTECIYETSFIEIEYDDGKSLAKKCIWALGAINTPESRDKLGLLAKSENTIVKEFATMELRRREIDK